MGLLFGLAVIGLVAAFVWFGFRKLRARLESAAADMAKLLHAGASATARIATTEKRRLSRHEFEYFVTYSFCTRDGSSVEKELRVSATHFDDFSEGASLDVVYLPDDPSVSATREMVETVRQAQLS